MSHQRGLAEQWIWMRVLKSLETMIAYYDA